MSRGLTVKLRVLVAPQEFKGSLTAVEAAEAIAAGVSDAVRQADVDLAPMSDGGPGLVGAMLAAAGGDRVLSDAHDPLMRPLRAAWALLSGGRAVVEMAAASGLVLLAEAERDALRASTYGTGELIAAALERGCTEIIVGAGGSATTDAGAGAMRALGAGLLDASGRQIPEGGGALRSLAHIDLSARHPRLGAARVHVATDVRSTLCGPQGAAQMFAPQKGASPDDVRVLEDGLRNFADVARREYDIDLLTMRGTGAAGGLAAGLATLCGATIEPGARLVAQAVGLEERARAADLVITGEGRLDAQTSQGKVASYVADLAHRQGKPVGIVAGTIEAGEELFDAALAAAPTGLPPEDAMRDGARLVRAAAARLTARLLAARG